MAKIPPSYTPLYAKFNPLVCIKFAPAREIEPPANAPSLRDTQPPFWLNLLVQKFTFVRFLLFRVKDRLFCFAFDGSAPVFDRCSTGSNNYTETCCPYRRIRDRCAISAKTIACILNQLSFTYGSLNHWSRAFEIKWFANDLFSQLRFYKISR